MFAADGNERQGIRLAELDGVTNQVLEHLLHLPPVGFNFWQFFHDDLGIFFLDQDFIIFHDLMDYFPQICERKIPGIFGKPGVAENIHNHSPHPVG